MPTARESLHRGYLMETYFNQLEQVGINPNFFTSREYLTRAGWYVEQEADCLMVLDEGGHCMLPTLGLNTPEANQAWSTFIEPVMPSLEQMDFLDYQFIYDPANFRDLSGRRWRTTRKNMEEAKADVGEGFAYQLLARGESSDALDLFLSEWAAGRDDMYDPEVMVDFLLHGDQRLLIIGELSRDIYGELVFDANYRYINFRYCIVKDEVRGLSDTCRVMFYRYIDQLYNRKVNDGGSLGRQSLYDYKMRLNPIEVGKIYTWRNA